MFKKIIISFLLISVLFPSCIAFSAEDGSYVYDEMEYISESGISRLNTIADEIYKKYDISPYVVLTSCDNDSIIDYVCEFRNDVENRIVLGVNDDYWYIYAGGEAEKIFPEDSFDQLWNGFNKGKTWYDSAKNFIEDTRVKIEFANELRSSGTGEAEKTETPEPEPEPEPEPVEIAKCDKRLYDGADLLTDDEEVSLLEKLDTLSEACGADIAVATVDSIGTYSPKHYADGYYDSNGFSPDGVILLISMEDRDWYISTCGLARDAIDDTYGINCISGRFLHDLSGGNYFTAFSIYADWSADFINHLNETGKPYNKFTVPKAPMGVIWYIVPIGIGLLIALIIVSVMRSKLISVSEKTEADDFVVSGSLKITNMRETFLYSTVTRTAKPEKSSGSSSSGGSSSHGGGGGKF